jgi:hypothetical protein
VAWSAREENRDSPQKALFAFRGESSFSQRVSHWSWTKRKAEVAWAEATSIRRASRKDDLCLFGMIGL